MASMNAWNRRFFARTAVLLAALGHGPTLLAADSLPGLQTSVGSIPDVEVVDRYATLKSVDAIYPALEAVAVGWMTPEVDRLDWRKPENPSDFASGESETLAAKELPSPKSEQSSSIPNLKADAPATSTATEQVALSGQSFLPGESKPDVASLPEIDQITPVNWAASLDSAASSKVTAASIDFQAEFCPSVQWSQTTRSRGPRIGECTEVLIPGQLKEDALSKIANASRPSTEKNIASSETAAGKQITDTKATLTKVAVTPTREIQNRISQEDLNELRQLSPQQPANTQAASDTYLGDLQTLLLGQSNWLFSKEGLLDLAPEEGTPSETSYLDELNQLLVENDLVPRSSRYSKTAVRRQEASLPPMVIPPRSSDTTYADIAPAPDCPPSSGAGISALFQPLASIQVTGLSTDPPRVPANAENAAVVLQRPVNEACGYLENASPVHYFTATRFGAARPSRNTHVLCHNPLYYEDENLERCGQSNGCLTTAVSAIHFGTHIAFTPYKLISECPTSCEQSLPDCPTCHEFD
jgi:hypothetical protein